MPSEFHQYSLPDPEEAVLPAPATGLSPPAKRCAAMLPRHQCEKNADSCRQRSSTNIGNLNTRQSRHAIDSAFVCRTIPREQPVCCVFIRMLKAAWELVRKRPGLVIRTNSLLLQGKFILYSPNSLATISN